MKQQKAVTLIPAKKKKRKSLKTETIKSADEEDEEDTIHEGFHLQAESPYCLNMQCSENYQTYLQQIVLEFEWLLKAGGKDMRKAYGQIIESFYWACKANKNTIIEEADRDQVLQSIKDLKCKAWKLKLNGRKTVDHAMLVDELLIGPQRASNMVSMTPQEVFEMLEEDLANKTLDQIKQIKDMIKNLCMSQALVHRHVANSADYLASLCDLVSLPFTIKVMNVTLRPVVAVRIPKVDDMIERAQEKVEKIKKAKEAMTGVRPIDEVMFVQNCPTYNPEWVHSREGRPTVYLASLVSRYMDELMRKDKKLVMSARDLETIYHKSSSLVGKLISGKLGGYKLDKIRDKKEKEGVLIPQKMKHKLLPKGSQPSTMVHE